MEEKYQKQLSNYYDEAGMLKQYPSKRPLRELVLAKLAQRFEQGVKYTEKEINEVIQSQIAFSDYELIRRELYQYHVLNRKKDGSEYWLEERFVFVEDKEQILTQVDDVKALLAQSYWAAQRSVEVIAESIKNSVCLAIKDTVTGRIVAFARVVTDYATVYYLSDVIVDESYRGKGLGKKIVEQMTVRDERFAQKRGLLLTKDAQTLYSQFGFGDYPETCMVK